MNVDFLLHLLGIVAFSLPNTLGYNLVFGKGKILHFGPLGLSVLSAYSLFLVQIATGNYLLALLASIIVTALTAMLFAWLALRLEPDGLGILTIAVHLALLAVVLNWGQLTRGALGLVGIQRAPFLHSLSAITIAGAAAAVLWIAFLLFVERSRLGRELQALAENEWHATALGISRKRVYMQAFLISGMGAVITNFFFHQYINLVHPSDFQFSATIFFVMCIVAGGPGSVLGVALSTTLLILLKECLRFVPLPYEAIGPVRLILFGIILILAVYARRKSLFPVQRTV